MTITRPTRDDTVPLTGVDREGIAEALADAGVDTSLFDGDTLTRAAWEDTWHAQIDTARVAADAITDLVTCHRGALWDVAVAVDDWTFGLELADREWSREQAGDRAAASKWWAQ